MSNVERHQLRTPATRARSNGRRHVVLLGAANSIHLQRWALALHSHGRRVSVVTQHATQALPLPPDITLHALPWISAAGYLLNAPSLRRLLRRLQPDLLHVHYASGYGTLARLAAWQPTLLSVWGSDVYVFPRSGALQAWLLRGNLRAAQALASTSEAMAGELRRWVPDAPTVHITPFGVDTDRFRPSVRRDGGALTIGIVKTLAPAYGIDLLLRAFAQLQRQLPATAMRLCIVGDGPQRAALEELASDLHLANRVEFVGPVMHEDVPRWLLQFDIFVAPSRHESFGVAVVEAMACGLPVVVSDAGGLPEVVEPGVSGLVVPAGEWLPLAEALELLVREPPLCRQLGAAARARAVAQYAWPRCVDRMIECQDAVMGQVRCA